MTNNTIPNVPRELLDSLLTVIESNGYAADEVEVVDELRALLSAPSPAGVDGLEVRAYEDSGGALYTAKLLEIMEVDSVGCEPLCRLSDAQAIIDGLRGEADQQAQRIGELEGLLLRVQVSLSLDDTEWGYSGAEKYKLLADIRAALSAGNEPKQCT